MDLNKCNNFKPFLLKKVKASLEFLDLKNNNLFINK